MSDAEIFGAQATAKGLRHAFAVRAVSVSVPITSIKIWMGHADLHTTSIYLNVRDEEEKNQIRKTWE